MTVVNTLFRMLLLPFSGALAGGLIARAFGLTLRFRIGAAGLAATVLLDIPAVSNKAVHEALTAEQNADLSRNH